MSEIKAIRTEEGEMKVTIESDGVRVTLDGMEVDKIYRLRQAYFDRSDLIHYIKTCFDEYDWSDELFCDEEEPFSIGSVEITANEAREIINDEEFMEDLVDTFRDALENNDGYFEEFSETVRCVVDRGIKNKMKEKNNENV